MENSIKKKTEMDNNADKKEQIMHERSAPT
jgi:hypothetical protein